ncbi:membrane protein [Ceratobasidium sp. AG-Ba]|nr:membrane protein [Ceratobasidium sp. AG-Ba]
MTILLYVFFAGGGCTLNQFLISFNLALCILITLICVHPAVQDANPRSGLAQASMVAAYCTYLITSAVGNHTDGKCNPLHRSPARNGTVIMGAIFTFLAIAYSTSRAATQSRALVGKKRATGAIALSDEDHTRTDSGVGLVTTQPTRKDTPRYQALLAAVEAGAIPASALDEDEDDEDGTIAGDERDDERTGTRYNYSWFHIIFVMGSMYVGMLLTDWNVVSTRPLPDNPDPNQDVYIGRSETAMWMRVVSSWVCILLYIWSLVAPVFFPDR